MPVCAAVSLCCRCRSVNLPACLCACTPAPLPAFTPFPTHRLHQQRPPLQPTPQPRPHTHGAQGSYPADRCRIPHRDRETAQAEGCPRPRPGPNKAKEHLGLPSLRAYIFLYARSSSFFPLPSTQEAKISSCSQRYNFSRINMTSGSGPFVLPGEGSLLIPIMTPSNAAVEVSLGADEARGLASHQDSIEQAQGHSKLFVSPRFASLVWQYLLTRIISRFPLTATTSTRTPTTVATVMMDTVTTISLPSTVGLFRLLLRAPSIILTLVQAFQCRPASISVAARSPFPSTQSTQLLFPM